MHVHPTHTTCASPLSPSKPPNKHSFPKEEEKVLALWDQLDAFKEQLRRSEGKPEYIFFDGPPFATGLPHYGHILAGTLKVGPGGLFLGGGSGWGDAGVMRARHRRQ